MAAERKSLGTSLLFSQPIGAEMSRRNYGSSRRLGIESLECRQLMAANPFGNVQVSVNTGGDLVLTSDSLQHDFEIVQATQSGVPTPGRYFIAPHQGTNL